MVVAGNFWRGLNPSALSPSEGDFHGKWAWMLVENFELHL